MSFTDKDKKETDKTKIRVSHSDGKYTLTIALEGEGDSVRIDPEFKMFHRTSPIYLAGGELTVKKSEAYSLFGKRLEKRRAALGCDYTKKGGREYYTVTFDMNALGMSEGDPFRLMIRRSGSRNDSFSPEDRMFTRLVTGLFSTDAFGFFVPKN